MATTMTEATMTNNYEPKDGDFLTIAETAQLWGVSERTVRREIEQRSLRVVRLGPSGRIVRTRRCDREAYLAARAAAGGAA
jgi:excisionase family DNA binding protein